MILQGLSAAVFTDYWLVIFNLTREIQCLPMKWSKKDNHQAASNKTLLTLIACEKVAALAAIQLPPSPQIIDAL